MTNKSGKLISYRDIGVIGAGAWGTALALTAAQAGRSVTLWAMEPEIVESIRSTRVNAHFLPDTMLPNAVLATSDLRAAARADAILLAAPAQYLRGMLVRLAPLLVD